MRINNIILLLFPIFFILQVDAQISQKLPIPGRLQWDNDNGYCGELSIQSIGLFYGNYISQDVCRQIAGGEVLFGNSNGETAIDKFSFTADSWDFNQSGVQYQNYLIWVKKHLNNFHPVILTVYVTGKNNSEYDHIIPAIGFKATSTSNFDNADELMFYDNYDSNLLTRTFQSIWDTRSMKGNGANYIYCIPKDVNYGVAITGIKDNNHVTKPVQLSINRWDEPNVSIGESPVQFNATIKIDSLTAGKKYALLRYNNYISVPSAAFNPVGASSVIYFTANTTQKTIADSFMSNTCAFYRCIAFDYNTVQQQANSQQISYHIYPNPTNSFLTIEAPQKSLIEISNIQGQLLQKVKAINPKTTLDISNLPKGNYYLKVTDNDHHAIEQIVIE